MPTIGIGVSDFKNLRTTNKYYIDKTLYIKDIIDNGSEIILITRSRSYDEAIRFFRDFCINTFKDNSYLEKAIISGSVNGKIICRRMAKKNVVFPTYEAIFELMKLLPF